MTNLEFQALIDRSLEGTLSDDEARPLWNEIRTDEARRARFLAERELHQDLRRLLTPGATDDAFLQGVLAELSTKRQDETAFARDVAARAARRVRRVPGRRPGRSGPWIWMAAAAALLAVAIFATLSPSRPRATETVRILPVPEEPASARRSEATASGEAPSVAPPQRREGGTPPVLHETPPAPAPPPPAPLPAPPNPEPPKPAMPEPPPRRTRTAIAQAERVRGEAFFIEGDAQTPVKEGDPIFAGLGVRSVGEQALVSFRFQDGTRLQVTGDAAIRDLSEASGKSLTLSEGILVAEVARQPAGRPLVIHTPHARVQVLGTQFVLRVTSESTGLEVEEGRVRLTRRDDGASTDVGKDQFAVAANGPAPSAKRLDSLLADPGFEKLGQGWMIFRPEGGLLGGRRIVSGGIRGGARALEIEADRTYPHQGYQDVAAFAGSFYSAKGWIKSKDLQAGRIELIWLNSTGVSDNPSPASIIRTDVLGIAAGTTDWLRISGRFKAPAGAKSVRFRIVTDAGSGFLWADDVRLTRTP